MFFDSYEIGRTATTQRRVISAADIDQFAQLTGDYNRLHIDETYATSTPFGKRIAHGLLVQSCAVGLVTTLIEMEHVLAFREAAVKFSLPVFIGDSIYVDITISAKKYFRRLNAGNVSLDFRVKNSDDSVVQQGCWQLLIKTS